jgi:hypothetical protein
MKKQVDLLIEQVIKKIGVADVANVANWNHHAVPLTTF